MSLWVFNINISRSCVETFTATVTWIKGEWQEYVCLQHWDKTKPIVTSEVQYHLLLPPRGSAGSPKWGSRWVLFFETAADHQSAKLVDLQPILLHPTTSKPPTNKPPQLSPTLFPLSSLYLSPSPSFSLAGCEDASSTLQWRQIRPSQPCHRKTSPRKVATPSPFQLIYRHGKSGKEEGSPCRSITTSSTLSQGNNRKILWIDSSVRYISRDGNMT